MTRSASAEMSLIKLRHKLDMEKLEVEQTYARERMLADIMAKDPSAKYFALALITIGAGSIMKFVEALADPNKKKNDDEDWITWGKRIGIAIMLPPGAIGLFAQAVGGDWTPDLSDVSIGVGAWASLCCLLYASNGSGVSSLVGAVA